MANADRCICCGEIVPEGRQICPQCERKRYIYTIPDVRRHSTSSPGADPHKAEDDSFSNVELQLCGSNDKENPRTEIMVKER